MLDGQHVKPPRTHAPIENAVRPDAVGPHVLLRESTFEGLAFLRVLAEITKGVFDAITNRRIECRKILDRLRCEANLPH